MSQQRKEEIQHIHSLNRRADKTRGKRVRVCVCAHMSKIYIAIKRIRKQRDGVIPQKCCILFTH